MDLGLQHLTEHKYTDLTIKYQSQSRLLLKKLSSINLEYYSKHNVQD